MLKLCNKRSSSFLHSAAAARVSIWGPKTEAAATNDFKFWRGLATQTAPLSGVIGKSETRIFAPYEIFKGKAALSAEPVMSTFTKLESGNFKVDRRGSIMLKFSPAIGERKYDWGKKQLFALSATEVGSLICLGSKDSCDFFHDPGMKTGTAGQVRKSLSIKAHDDGSGYFFSLSVVNNILKTNDRIVVPLSTAEFEVLRTAFSYALPHIMGWDQFANLGIQIAPGDANQDSPKAVEEELVPIEEWEG